MVCRKEIKNKIKIFLEVCKFKTPEILYRYLSLKFSEHHGNPDEFIYTLKNILQEWGVVIESYVVYDTKTISLSLKKEDLKLTLTIRPLAFYEIEYIDAPSLDDVKRSLEIWAFYKKYDPLDLYIAIYNTLRYKNKLHLIDGEPETCEEEYSLERVDQKFLELFKVSYNTDFFSKKVDAYSIKLFTSFFMFILNFNRDLDREFLEDLYLHRKEIIDFLESQEKGKTLIWGVLEKEEIELLEDLLKKVKDPSDLIKKLKRFLTLGKLRG